MTLVRAVIAAVLSQRGIVTPAEVYDSLTRKGIPVPLRRYSSAGKARQAVRLSLCYGRKRGLIFSPAAGFYRRG